jgi:hypothetical protein
MRIITSIIAVTATAVLVLAADPGGTVYGQEAPVYGSQLMTDQERQEHQERMRAATTEEERQQIRAEHHARMQERAEERGVTLPDEPPMRGMGQGMGAGQGGMMGQGGGAGRRGN